MTSKNGISGALRRLFAPLLDPLECVDSEYRVDLSPAPIGSGGDHLSQLELKLKQKSREIMAGRHKSLVRGQGLDFARLRQYVPGDDVRKIDWNVFARTFVPQVREYQQEQQLVSWLIVDFTPSMFFGRKQLKAQRAMELAGLLGLLSAKQGDRLGLYCFGAGGRKIIKPMQGQTHLRAVMQTLHDCYEQELQRVAALDGRVMGAVFKELTHLAAKHSSLFIMSDFLSREDTWQQYLGELSRKQGIFSFLFGDQAEMELPAGLGVMELFDPESGTSYHVDTDRRDLRREYAASFSAFQQELKGILKTFGRLIVLNDDSDIVQLLLNHLLSWKH